MSLFHGLVATVHCNREEESLGLHLRYHRRHRCRCGSRGFYKRTTRRNGFQVCMRTIQNERP